MNFPGPSRLPNFDKDFGKVQKRATSLIGVAFTAWIIWACICLSLVGAVIYVVVHFLSKVW